jgi:hypothetical protein
MKVAIGTYDRPQECRDKTLAFLRRAQWPAKDVFVANAREHVRYVASLRVGSYGKLLSKTEHLEHSVLRSTSCWRKR